MKRYISALVCYALLTPFLGAVSVSAAEARLQTLELQAHHAEKPVFVHAVYFWLHDHVTEGQKAEFMELLKNFKRIKSVKRVYVGPPAGTPRTVVDNSYDVALIVEFKDKAGHDYYQADKIHTDAIAIFEGWIRELKIYDMVQD